MHNDHEKRARLEADIAAAVRGPDYSQIENSIAKNKSMAQQLLNMQREIKAKSRIPINNEGASEDVSRARAITGEHKERKRYTASQRRRQGLEP